MATLIAPRKLSVDENAHVDPFAIPVVAEDYYKVVAEMPGWLPPFFQDYPEPQRGHERDLVQSVR